MESPLLLSGVVSLTIVSRLSQESPTSGTRLLAGFLETWKAIVSPTPNFPFHCSLLCDTQRIGIPDQGRLYDAPNRVFQTSTWPQLVPGERVSFRSKAALCRVFPSNHGLPLAATSLSSSSVFSLLPVWPSSRLPWALGRRGFALESDTTLVSLLCADDEPDRRWSDENGAALEAV